MHHRCNEVVDWLAKEAATLHKDQVDRADMQAMFLKGWREHYHPVAKLLGMWHGKQTIFKHRKGVDKNLGPGTSQACLDSKVSGVAVPRLSGHPQKQSCVQ